MVHQKFASMNPSQAAQGAARADLEPSEAIRFAARVHKRLLALGAHIEEEKLFALLSEIERGGTSIEAGEEPLSLGEGLVLEEGRLYLQKSFQYKQWIALHAERVRKSPPRPLFDPEKWERSLNIAWGKKRMTEPQRAALEKMFQETLVFLYGGPGSGKTYTAALFLELLSEAIVEKETLHVCVAAPTGKAAIHLSRTISNALLQKAPGKLVIRATTLHALLKLRPGKNRLFQQSPIDADLVLVDEASMIGAPLFAHLLGAIVEGTRLLFMGDPHQLPPVEERSPFPHFAKTCGIGLSGSVRTEEKELLELANAALKEPASQVLTLLKQRGKIEPLDASFFSPEKLLRWLSPLYGWEKPDVSLCHQWMKKRRILNPLRKGPLGAERLNQEILERLEGEAEHGMWLMVPLLLTANDAYQDWFNGMSAVLLKKKGTAEREIFLEGESEPLQSTPSAEPAFCLSVHKSQGSEFEEALLLFPSGSERLEKEIFYTAVTRAKRRICWAEEREGVVERLLRR